VENDETKPNTAGKGWSSGKQVVFHDRSRSAPGSHPSGTPVASRKSDRRAGQLLSHRERRD